MRPDTTLNLGDFQFAAFEIPGEIPVGGAQRLVRHELVGGIRVVDSMGRSDRALDWSGFFMGSTALDRARRVDALRIAGQPLQLTWSQYRYTVVIQDFKADFRRQFEIPYSISCEVVSDNTQPSTQSGAAPIDAALGDDLDTANSLGPLINDPTLTSLLSNLSKSMGLVTTFANASHVSVNGVLAPLALVQNRVNQLLVINNSGVANAPGFAGILPFKPAAAVVSSFSSQVGGVATLSSLVLLSGVLGRMSQNLNGIDASETSVGVAGGNLFGVASQQYGDATAWTTIARANGLTDPFISGSQVLAVPPNPDQAGGILDA